MWRPGRDCLCCPGLWPSWYPNSSNVRIKNQTQPDLRLGTEFRWKTFGVTIDFTVLEFVRHERWHSVGLCVISNRRSTLGDSRPSDVLEIT
jgi:hypothetical protein